MSGLFNKIKGSFDGISNKMKADSSAIAKVIKENKELVDAEDKLTKESLEGIKAFREFAKIEKLSLGHAFDSMATSMEAIEAARKEKTAALRDKFISPLNEIMAKYKGLLTEISEAEAAKRNLDSAKKDLDKKKKAAEQGKGKPGDVEASETKFKAAQEKFQKEENEAKEATVKFNEEKIQKIHDSLKALVDEQRKFYQIALEQLGAAEKVIEEITVEDAAVISDEPEEPAEQPAEQPEE